MAAMLSRISGSRCGGFLEGVNRIPKYRVPEQRLDCSSIDDVGSPRESFIDEQLDSCVVEHPEKTIRIEFDEIVHVAMFAGLSASNGTEDRSVKYTKFLQVLTMQGQRFESLHQSDWHFTRRLPEPSWVGLLRNQQRGGGRLQENISSEGAGGCGTKWRRRSLTSQT